MRGGFTSRCVQAVALTPGFFSLCVCVWGGGDFSSQSTKKKGRVHENALKREKSKRGIALSGHSRLRPPPTPLCEGSRTAPRTPSPAPPDPSCPTASPGGVSSPPKPPQKPLSTPGGTSVRHQLPQPGVLPRRAVKPLGGHAAGRAPHHPPAPGSMRPGGAVRGPLRASAQPGTGHRAAAGPGPPLPAAGCHGAAGS